MAFDPIEDAFHIFEQTGEIHIADLTLIQLIKLATSAEDVIDEDMPHYRHLVTVCQHDLQLRLKRGTRKDVYGAALYIGYHKRAYPSMKSYILPMQMVVFDFIYRHIKRFGRTTEEFISKAVKYIPNMREINRKIQVSLLKFWNLLRSHTSH